VKKKVYKVKPTKKQMRVIVEYWKQMCAMQNRFYRGIGQLETIMEKDTGIKDIEFIMCDNCYIGIGNADRSMKLIQLDPV